MKNTCACVPASKDNSFNGNYNKNNMNTNINIIVIKIIINITYGCRICR